MARFKPLSEILRGQSRFGRLTVVGEVEPDKTGRRLIRCDCDCGGERTTNAYNLLNGHSTSCGCESRARIGAKSIEARRKHGDAGHGYRAPEYGIWRTMNSRCFNPNVKCYPDYGGRGISVAPEWRGPDGYESFIAHVGKRPAPNLSLDRIDNDGDYAPGNIRWATAKQQRANQRGRRDRSAV